MSIQQRSVLIPADGIAVEGDLTVPSSPQGIVAFAHGSGSSRFSPRNRFVAAVLQRAGLATLLLDLLTPREESIDQVTGHLRFNITLLAARVVSATDWLVNQQDTRDLAVGYFGASTGAAAALVAAAERADLVRAVVSRGGRPDLAGDALTRVPAPTLLIVGSRDDAVIQLNQAAFQQLRSEKRLEIVPRATHLFEEPGTLEEVARMARDWFLRYLTPDETRAAARARGSDRRLM